MLSILLLAALYIPSESAAAPLIMDETFDSSIPAGWTQIQYSGTGFWEWSNHTSTYYPPNTDGHFVIADSDANMDYVYDVGLFTSSMDMSGLASVQIEFDKNFQVFDTFGEAHVATYSGGTDVANLEEVLEFWDTDDSLSGEHVSYTIDPSTYDDPSDVYVEFWYSSEGAMWAWSFAIDNLKIETLNELPVASFLYAPNGAYNSIAFDASASFDPDGTIALYEWDFDNDGVYEETGVNVAHTFYSGGNHDVTLRVTDDDGATDTYEDTITIPSQANPTVAFMPIKNNNLARANALWNDIMGMLPNDIPADIEGILAQVQIHIKNSNSTANTIYANNELLKAIELLEEVLSLL